MLPDYPKLKTKLSKFLFDFFNLAQTQKMGLLAEINKRTLFEGHKTVLIREDGTVEQVESQKIAIQIKVDPKEVGSLTLKEILRRISQGAEEMAKEQSKMFFKEVSRSAAKVGNVFDAEGKPINLDIILKAYERMWIDFDEHGQPILQQLIAGKDIFESTKKLFSDLKSDPEKQRQFDEKFREIIEKKRMEWHDREDARKLVG